MVTHFALIGRVLEQTGSSRQKTLQFEYFDAQLCLKTLEAQCFETDENQMQPDRTYLIQGTASLRDGSDPRVSFSYLLLPSYMTADELASF